jgi:hypothetical protein
MTARVVACAKPGSACCARSIDMYKIELDVNPECKGAVSGVTVNGSPALVPTFDPYGSDNSKAVIKLTVSAAAASSRPGRDAFPRLLRQDSSVA